MTVELGVLAAAGTQHLPGVFSALESTLSRYGYLAVGGVLFLENLGLPVPGETMLVAASLYAALGNLNIVAVGVVAVLSSTLGSLVGYAIGTYGGRPLAEKYGKYVLLTADRLDRTERFMDRRGWLVVLLGRFVDGLRQAAGIIAGLSEMTLKWFVFYTFLGALLWVAVWCTVGEVAGDHVTTVSRYITYIGAALLALVVIGLLREALRSRRRRAASRTATE